MPHGRLDRRLDAVDEEARAGLRRSGPGVEASNFYRLERQERRGKHGAKMGLSLFRWRRFLQP